MKEKGPLYAGLGLLALLLYMPFLGHLNNLPIRLYDESRLAMNAYEMMKSGNWLVTTFAGQPDMWNTKPPLMIWMQCVWMKIIGVNELAVRLPSALAALFTCLAMFRFAVKYLRSPAFGIVAVLVLVTSGGYTEVHAARTGDYDALLTLFTTLSGLSFLLFIQYKSVRYLYGCAVWLTLATLTKGIVAFLFLPAMMIYAWTSGSIMTLWTNRHFYVALLGWVGVTSGYYLLREYLNPGYLQAVYVNELGGRYLEVIEHHQHGFWYYVRDLGTGGFFPWWILLPLGIWVGLRHHRGVRKSLIGFSVWMSCCFLLVISSASTKLAWYEVPVYPWLALIAAMGIMYLYRWLRIRFSTNGAGKPIAIGLLVVLFAIPYFQIWSRTYTPDESDWDGAAYDISYFLRDALKGHHDIQGYKIVHPGYHPEVEFYTRMLQDQGIRVQYDDYRALRKGDKVIVSKPEIKDSIVTHLDTKLLYHVNTVEIHLVYSPYSQ